THVPAERQRGRPRVLDTSPPWQALLVPGRSVRARRASVIFAWPQRPDPRAVERRGLGLSMGGARTALRVHRNYVPLDRNYVEPQRNVISPRHLVKCLDPHVIHSRRLYVWLDKNVILLQRHVSLLQKKCVSSRRSVISFRGHVVSSRWRVILCDP